LLLAVILAHRLKEAFNYDFIATEWQHTQSTTLQRCGEKSKRQRETIIAKITKITNIIIDNGKKNKAKTKDYWLLLFACTTQYCSTVADLLSQEEGSSRQEGQLLLSSVGR
jgi:hypothetical protein